MQHFQCVTYVPIVFQKKSDDEEEQEIKDCIVIPDEDDDIPESEKEDNEEHNEVIEEPSNEDNVGVIEQASNEDNIEVIEEPTTVREEVLDYDDDEVEVIEVTKKRKRSKDEVVIISEQSDEDQSSNSTMKRRKTVAHVQPLARVDNSCSDTLISIKEEKLDIKEEKASSVTSVSRGRHFNTSLFSNVMPDIVMRIPHHIDGQSFYMIDVPEDESYTRLIKDSRFFELHTSTRKGFRGVRKVGQCRGNFVCSSESCTYFLSAGRNNVHQFNIVGGRRFCFSCNALCERQYCGAQKLVEFSPHNRVLRSITKELISVILKYGILRMRSI